MASVSPIKDLVGIPFQNGGRDPSTGLDCWGLTRLVLARFGYEAPDYQASAFDSAGVSAAALAARCGGQWTEVQAPAPGVVVLMALDPYFPDAIQHFGVCLNDREFLQTLEKTGSIITRLDHPFFARRIKGFCEWKTGR
ncbi:MAG: NlpC/P60 family protein [Thermodesulfobacteriota bacterium]